MLAYRHAVRFQVAIFSMIARVDLARQGINDLGAF